MMYSGYMAPEYAMHGNFSVKSDVFSFGVLILEIVSGQRNSSFGNTDRVEDLISSVRMDPFQFEELGKHFSFSILQKIL